VGFLRERLRAQRLLSAQELNALPNGRLARACGLVTVRQQPGTAHGVLFITLEDETGHVNVVVWRQLKERQREVLLHARLLAVYGVWQRDVQTGGKVAHLIAKRVRDCSAWLGELAFASRDFH
jgi:error-prone DNA polymerase